ncbi:MAG: hypothetical protein DWI25_07115 [Planctomycetota bacterium]|nr:MAG: hypothetical protein DWI25_07115 [Planctomycetota bacterium]
MYVYILAFIGIFVNPWMYFAHQYDPPPSTAPLPERDSVSVKTKGGHSMLRGKKELAEQIIP